MLRPGTTLPSPSTISHDVSVMYEKGSVLVREYFKVSFQLLDLSAPLQLIQHIETHWFHSSRY